MAIKNVNDTISMLTAFREGGINCAEITFRTASARDAIELAVKTFPDMNIGAGTVIFTRDNHCSLDLFFTFKMINRIINGFINDEILLQLKDIGLESEAMENETYKQLIIDNLEGKRKDEKILNSIKFKYDDVLNLSNYYQRKSNFFCFIICVFLVPYLRSFLFIY